MADNTIWFDKHFDFNRLKNKMAPNTLGATIGITWHDMGPDYLVAKMPVDGRTRQPYGLLHGGASVALAETVGSVASYLSIDTQKFYCVGMEINANHLQSVREGFVYGTARPLRLGKTVHVWDLRIQSESGALVCVCRHTVAILPIDRAGEAIPPAF